MGSHDPFGHFKHKFYGQKKGRESHWQFDFQLLKVENCPNFLTCRWRVTYRWEALNEKYNFALNLISIGGLHTKLWAPKVAGIPIVGISKFPLGNPRTKWHLSAGPVAMHRVYYKGEGGGFPQVWAMVNFVSPCLLMNAHAPKCSNYALTNLLFGLCRSMWVIELLVILLDLILELQHALLPPKCCKLRSAPQLLLLLMSSPLHS